MTTKEQERAAVEKIRKIIEELGENSYVGFAMEGVLELAEENIREDTAYSMKERVEFIEERAQEAEKENKLLKAELGTAKKITEENNKVIARLKADICDLKANEVPEGLIKEMYSMAYDKEAEMIEKMEKNSRSDGRCKYCRRGCSGIRRELQGTERETKQIRKDDGHAG